MIRAREARANNYKQAVMALICYEDQNVEYFSDSDSNNHILTHTSSVEVKEKIDNATLDGETLIRKLTSG